jgi:predicted ATP-dependent Lon-type protease
MLGIVCKDAKAHAYAILDLIMAELQAKINVMYGDHVPNKHYTDHLSLTHDLPLLLSSMLTSIVFTWKVPENN